MPGVRPKVGSQKRVILWVVVALLIGATATGGYYLSRAYLKWREGRLLANAREFLNKSDYRNVDLTMRAVLGMNPNQVEAFRIMADLSDRLESPHAVHWHRRLAEAEPEVFGHYLRWTRAALAAGAPPLAEQALAAVPAPNRESAMYHHLAASVALAAKQFDKAEAACAEALRISPTNELYQLDLATVRIQSTNTAMAESARPALEKLAAGSAYRVQAMRTLIAHEVRNQRLLAAAGIAKELQSDAKAEFGDKVQYLNLLRAMGSPEAEPHLQALKKIAKVPDIFKLTSWLIAAGRGKEAHDWVLSLPKETQNEQPVELAMTDCLVSRRDWPAAERYLRNKVWVDFEFMRLAILARAAREQGDPPRSREYWSSALRLATRQPESIFTLARVSKDWGWEPEMVETLWIIARSPYNPKWALNLLMLRYQAKGDSHGLYRVAVRMVELEPDNDLARNNVAQLSLLLKVGESQAHQEAQKLYQKDPTSPVFASTYAFSQLVQGRAANGVKALQALPTARLAEPELAAYYAMLLAAQGDKATARKFLELAKNAPLLPEERAFLNKAVTAAK